MTECLLFSGAPEFSKSALSELRVALPGLTLLEWVDEGVGRVEWSGTSFSQVAEKLRDTAALFVRHLAPVQLAIPLPKMDGFEDELRGYAAALLPALDAGLRFSVQARVCSSLIDSISRKSVAELLGHEFCAAGLTCDVAAPEQIVSVFVTSRELLMGVSFPHENLSPWAGGEQRFAWEEKQICRAEFKLLEALSLFSLPIPASGKALDLGASPGGWTRVLRKRGLQVTAVDPGALHSSLETDAGVEHFSGTVQRFLASRRGSGRSQFDLLVNDMRMDVNESIRMTLQAAPLLKPGGFIVMTLKLPTKRGAEFAHRAVASLSRDFELWGARQLFHNRSEVTVVLRVRRGNEG